MRPAYQILMVLFFCSSVPACSQPAFAQQGAPSPQVTLGPVVREISLDVVVTDKSGNPVPGLQLQDFTLLDDKQPQTIRSFHAIDETTQAADAPQEVFFLVDAVNTSFQSTSLERQQLEKFLRQDGGHLSIPMS